MVLRGGFGVVCAVLAAAGLSSTGCVPVQQHREVLGDLQRLRMEAWQRGVEAAALRLALDRATTENAQLRGQPPAEQGPALVALTARLDQVARRQEIIAEEIRGAGVCVQPASGSPSADRSVPAAQPRPRQVTDVLYSRF